MLNILSGEMFHQQKWAPCSISTTNINTVAPSDNVSIADSVLNIRQYSHPYIHWDICSYALAQACWTRNKSDYWVHGVMFNNKMYYLPRSMCVALAIKRNEWKAPEGRSKFWCVVILSTLWQHTARQGCKTSSNGLLNIRLLHSCTPWQPYINSRPHAKVREPLRVWGIASGETQIPSRGSVWGWISMWACVFNGEINCML